MRAPPARQRTHTYSQFERPSSIMDFPSGRIIGNRRKHDKLLRISMRWIHDLPPDRTGSSLTIADGDGTGFIEQQCIYVAGRFYRFTRLGDYIGTAEHDPSRQYRWPSSSPPIGCWDQAHEQREQSGDRKVTLRRIVRQRLQRGAHDHEYQRESGQQDRQCDFVRGFLARKRLRPVRSFCRGSSRRAVR